MKWTRDKPKEPGTYWSVVDGEVSPVEVSRWTTGYAFHPLDVDVVGSDVSYDIDDFEWWMGPIDKPELPDDTP